MISDKINSSAPSPKAGNPRPTQDDSVNMIL
jgi:hypothetical protein